MEKLFLQRRLHRTTFLTAACVGVLAGIAAAGFGARASGWALYAVAGLCIAAACWQRCALWLPVAAAGGMLLGSVHAGAYLASLAPYDGLRGTEVVVTGIVSEDPTYSDKGRRHLFIGDVTLRADGQTRELPGQLFVSTPLSVDVRRQDRVRVEGTLRDGFGQFQGSVYFATIAKLGSSQHLIDQLRSQFAASTSAVLPEPHASLGLGFVIGMKSALTNELEDTLRDLSLTHIVVASGYNLTILVRAAKRLREKKSKLQALLLSGGLIGLFLLVTGNSPSMVRAALVSGLTLLAWYYGRQFKPHVLLLLVAAATAFYNPVYLWGDLGWWLSFAAFAGIMIVAPLLIERFWHERRPSFVTQIAIEALVAQLMTMPIIMLVFGDVALLGVIANVLVVPLVPFAMLATAVAGFAGMLLPTIAAYIAIPAAAVLSLIVSVINVLAAVPGTTHRLPMGLPSVLAWYCLVAAATALVWLRLSSQRKQRVLAQQIV